MRRGDLVGLVGGFLLHCTPAAPGDGVAAAGAGDSPLLQACRRAQEPGGVRSVVETACVPVAEAVQGRLRSALGEAFTREAPGEALALEYRCDRLGVIDELLFESASESGGYSLVRLRLRAEVVEAVRISTGKGDAPTVERGSAPRSEIEAELPPLRALTLADLSHVVTQRLPAAGPLVGEHRRLFLLGEGGRIGRLETFEPDGDRNPVREVVILEAARIVAFILSGMSWQPAAIDDDLRAVYVRRFADNNFGAVPLWVTEHHLKLAPRLGDASIGPRLVRLVERVGDDEATKLQRALAVDALAAVAGYDARTGGDGQPVPVEEAAAAYARECARAHEPAAQSIARPDPNRRSKGKVLHAGELEPPKAVKNKD